MQNKDIFDGVVDPTFTPKDVNSLKRMSESQGRGTKAAAERRRRLFDRVVKVADSGKDEEKYEDEPRDISLNRFGAWQSIHKGTRQHWGNRTVVFTDLRHEVLRDVLAEDFKGHEFEFEPSLRGQVEEFVAQSMDLEVEEKLNDPFWRKVYLDAYKFERGDFAVSLGPDEKRGKHWPRLVRSEGRVEIDCDGMPFIENLAHYTTGVLNCDTQEWRSF